VEARRQGSEVVISVSDTGIGISPERIPAMFELFAQGERSLARSEGGLGLGLTIVRSLVEMHGGRIAAHSDGEGKGTAFIVRLPASEGSESRAAQPAAGEAIADAARILVVDDNIDTAEGLARLLKRRGHQVKVTYEGVSAIDLARSFCPDFVLLDLGLPGMDGYEVAVALRADEACQRATIIAVSGYGQEEDRRRSREAGFDHHFVKPVDFAELEATLARCRQRAEGELRGAR
jgi:CheY-like chemotaxis protein